MSKITTADCKKFLVAEIAKNNNIIHDIFGDTVTAINEAQVEKNWKRESKFSPTGDGDYAEDRYYFWRPTYGHSGNWGSIDAKDLTCVRRFILDPKTFDSAVMFNVLEDKNGKLHLGEYVGD